MKLQGKTCRRILTNEFLPTVANQCPSGWMRFSFDYDWSPSLCFIGSIISGAIDVYITPEKVYRALPKNKWGRILFGTLIGFIFPSCECGIVPIINRFLEKKVPSYTAVPFLVTAPVINPIVLFATYSAFGNSIQMALLRAIGSILVATVLGIFLGFFQTASIQRANRKEVHVHDFSKLSAGQRFFQVFVQAIDEFSTLDAIWSSVVYLPVWFRFMCQLAC